MGSSDVGAIRPEITQAWGKIPDAFGAFVAELTPEKVRLLQDEASKTFMERSGLGQVELEHINEFMEGRKTQLETLASQRVLAALAGEANRLWEKYGSVENTEYHILFRSIAAELRGSGSRKEQK